jgi:7,8-dihydropterin-6-yl-methyl-4-(beta-D-ribofuranosyl)aminobenzene 5'-phosphate synthase
VPRKHPERNYPGTGVLRNLKADVPDNIPEDASLLFRTDAGIVVLTGCGHAGIVNISDHARDILGAVPVVAVVGGLHLFDASDETLAWTAAQLKARGIRYLLAGHCTGIEATFVLRRLAGLDRKTAVVSSVGSSLDPKKGIEPLLLAR